LVLASSCRWKKFLGAVSINDSGASLAIKSVSAHWKFAPDM